MPRFLIVFILGVLFAAAGTISAIITLMKRKGQKANVIAPIAFVIAGLFLIAVGFVLYK